MFVLAFITLLFPVYPWLANAFYKNTATERDFYRWDIDKKSIVKSLSIEDLDVKESEYLTENVDAFISVDTILDDNRNTSGLNEIVKYTVEDGESYESIASDFWVSKNSILWANDFDTNHVIHPGDVIKVPPVTGLVYTVKKWDSLEGLAAKYEIELTTIEEQNSIRSSDLLKVGQVVVLPGAKKIIPKPKPKPQVATTTSPKRTQARSSASKNTFTPAPVSAWKGRYQLQVKWGHNRFYAGNCTWFVRHYKKVTWWGNANMWIRNARAQWYKIGKTPVPGSIVQLTGRWYNPRYGHVAIVLQVHGNTMTIIDMNYSGRNVVTERKISVNHPAIDGYIYGVQ